jgi:hypothetical protein
MMLLMFGAVAILTTLLVAVAEPALEPSDAEPIDLWVRNVGPAPICEVHVRFRSHETVVDGCVTTEVHFAIINDRPIQLEWRDSTGLCHVENLDLPRCTACGKTWHMGDVAEVSNSGVRYKCECWQPWESFEMNEEDPPYPQPRSTSPP